MRTVRVVECQVAPGGMAEFTNAVQQWERAVLDHPDGPDYHSVLVNDRDPSRVLILTYFPDRDTALRFEEAGMFEPFYQGVMSCIRAEPDSRTYSVFYGAGTGGPRAIFGSEHSGD